MVRLMSKICVIGLGYVGLTLAVTLADCGMKTVGVDINKNTVELLNKGKPHFHEPGLEFIVSKQIRSNLEVYDKIPEDKEINTYIIAVATPVDEDKRPRMNYVKQATEDICKHLKKGDLIVLRSTVPVGTTNKVVREIVESKTELRFGEDVHAVFAPERTIEGKALEELRYLPQIIGGNDEEAVNLAANIFNKVTNTVVRVSTPEAAEIAKQLDNIYRDVNIALGNEIGLACEQIGQDAYEIIRAANRNYDRNKIMLPGSGVGGACLTKDPYIFLSQIKTVPEHSIIFHSRKINEGMPAHVHELAKEGLAKTGKEMKGSKIAILGFAFKGWPETSDARFSPVWDLVDLIKKDGGEIVGVDPVVKKHDMERVRVAADYDEAFDGCDCVIVMNNHPNWREIDFRRYKDRLKADAVFVDGWRMLRRKELEQMGYIFRGVGVE